MNPRSTSGTLSPLACAIGLICSAGAHAGINSDGAWLRGGSGTDWSSSLGPDYNYPIVPELGEPQVGPGNTSPQRPAFYFFHGESLDNSSYYSSPDYLGSAQRVEIADSGNVEGKVHHWRADTTIPEVGGNGLGAHSNVNTNFVFDGGTPGTPTSVYYTMDWRIETDMLPLQGQSMALHADVGSFGNAVDVSGLPQNLSGHRSGFFVLGNCNGGTSFSGAGCNTSQFEFSLFNGAGSSAPGGHASVDVWFSFSASPIDILPAVPEPNSGALFVAGLLALGWARQVRHSARRS